jgi:hypothetical protein
MDFCRASNNAKNVVQNDGAYMQKLDFRDPSTTLGRLWLTGFYQ